MILKCLKQFCRSTEGATALEYGLIAGIIAVGVASAMSPLRQLLIDMYGTVIAAFPG